MSFQTGHVGLNVTDLDASKAFYERVFGFSVAGESKEDGRRYAFLAQDGTLVLTLWQQSEGRFGAGLPGLHHLSFQVVDLAAVRRAEAVIRELGATLHHDGVVPHGEGASSGGVFFEDPDGIRLEIFAPDGAGDRGAPTSGAPTCGFF
ncbi:Glyoxalase/Bleomycin resistance protein/Dioxygenase superfamily protein [Nonomuraea solani]|uniref:Glyoxalase/Bleomycin resistance protein/Dioxygenase superfamily protein n=1 Tax=Nonomuraea solani TaxID=1144553 RepID=A0A1H6EYE3_9ACTN|nr:VOC family protein [Nonomuraea solani]SEH02792.1 Glyoxalase/Bleomycin resistance protein/Dioxygenase superfamily protein [Nonomuraea solani]